MISEDNWLISDDNPVQYSDIFVPMYPCVTLTLIKKTEMCWLVKIAKIILWCQTNKTAMYLKDPVFLTDISYKKHYGCNSLQSDK